MNTLKDYMRRVAAKAKKILGSREAHAVLIMLFLLVPTFFVLLLTTAIGSTYKQFNRANRALVSVAEEIQLDEKSGKEAVEDFNTLAESNVKLTSTMLKSLITDEGYIGPRVFSDGVVAQVVDGQLVYPEGTHSALLDLTLDDINKILEEGSPGIISIETNSMQFDAEEETIEVEDPNNPEESYTSCFVRPVFIAPDLVFIDVTPEDDLWSSIGSKDYATKAFDLLEETFGGAVFVVKAEESLEVIYHTSFFTDFDYASEIGLTLSDIEKGDALQFIDGVLYLSSSKYLQKYDCYAIFLYPLVSVVSHIASRSFFIVIVMAIILSTLITYIFASIRYARSGKLTEEELAGFHPQRLKNHAIAISIVGVLVIFTVTFFVHMLGSVQMESLTADRSLTDIFEGLEKDKADKRNAIINEGQDWYAYYAVRIANLISDYPELATKENLQSYCDIIGADYIMLFDTKGSETLCSKDYVGFALGTGQGDESGDFRRLLRGVKVIKHGASTDSVTGLNDYHLGVTLPTPDINANGALIMAIPQERIYDTSSEPKTNVQLAALATEDMILFSADKSKATVVNSSESTMCGFTIEECGLSKSSMSDDFMDFARVGDEPHLGVTREGQDLF
ncbi:MAG: hypothetical protein IJ092_11780 [Atopobiaceae bacterium]|nr:hypothetical protein [Atopobiaceae bacterium]